MSSKPEDLLVESYDYQLPEELIAMRPATVRHESKLLVYKVSTDEIIHDSFSNISNYIPKESLVVLNKSKVFPCRLVGKKSSGGKCEFFVLSLEPNDDGSFEVLIKARGKKREGDQFCFEHGVEATISKVFPGTFHAKFNIDNLEDHLHKFGKVPIPPYIRGGDSDDTDKEDYQTVYAREVGSVAAPTAGLHFSDKIFSDFKKKGIDHTYVTLHVGLGTFRPVQTKSIREHKMHAEKFFVEEEALSKIKQARKVFAVGTTSLRVLESSYNKEIVPEKNYETDIFLHPGVDVQSIDGLITNFHLPKSTLLMLVSSLVGREKTLELYQEAIKKRYRFFSYGDAMLIIR